MERLVVVVVVAVVVLVVLVVVILKVIAAVAVVVVTSNSNGVEEEEEHNADDTENTANGGDNYDCDDYDSENENNKDNNRDAVLDLLRIHLPCPNCQQHSYSRCISAVYELDIYNMPVQTYGAKGQLGFLLYSSAIDFDAAEITLILSLCTDWNHLPMK